MLNEIHWKKHYWLVFHIIPPLLFVLLKSLFVGNKDDLIKKRLSGEDDLTKKYIAKIKDMRFELPVPDDPTITTLFLGSFYLN